MQNFDKGIISAALIVLIVMMALFSLNQAWKFSLGAPLTDIKTVNVQGEGKVSFQPELAQAIFSVVSEGLTPREVQDANTKKMNQVVGYLKQQGVEEKDMKTTGYYLNPRYFYPERGGTPYISGYELSQSLTVKIRDLNKVGDILAGAVENGVNQTSGLSFTVDDDRMEELKIEAREKAFADAKSKAKAMANVVGVRLGSVVGFNESFYGTPVPYEFALGKGGGGAGPVAPDIQPGSQEIAVSVNITYQIK